MRPRRRIREARPDEGRRRAAGIYGTILTAAVLASGGNALTTAELEVTVLVTLLIYWIAEQYADLLGEHTHGGRLPTAAEIRKSLSSSFPIVTASFLPLIAMLVARLLGADESSSVAVALGVALLLLLYHGHAAGRAAGLKGVKLIATIAVAGLLGAGMIVLKSLLHRPHHL